MKKWTVAFVNYKTDVYLKWQLKILFEFNDPTEFDVVIVDNSSPHQEAELEKLAKPYNDQYDNIRIYFFKPTVKAASGQHGEGLTEAVKHACSEYFLAQDPDFFFVKKDYLKFLASFLDSGMVAVGAPYNAGVGLGHPRFPALYGAAHPLALIKHLDCNAEISKEKLEESLDKFRGLEYSYDVGYKIRDALSSKDDDSNFVSFEFSLFTGLSKRIGEHSYETITQKYTLKNEIIAYHLFRGSFTDAVVGNYDLNKKLPQKTLRIRNKFGEYFYNHIKIGRPPKIALSLNYCMSLSVYYLKSFPRIAINNFTRVARKFVLVFCDERSSMYKGLKKVHNVILK